MQSCKNCKWCKPLEKWDWEAFGKGEQWKSKCEGYACTVFDEGVIWMVGSDPEEGHCEMWGEKCI